MFHDKLPTWSLVLLVVSVSCGVFMAWQEVWKLWPEPKLESQTQVESVKVTIGARDPRTGEVRVFTLEELVPGATDVTPPDIRQRNEEKIRRIENK